MKMLKKAFLSFKFYLEFIFYSLLGILIPVWIDLLLDFKLDEKIKKHLDKWLEKWEDKEIYEFPTMINLIGIIASTLFIVFHMTLLVLLSPLILLVLMWKEIRKG